MVFTSDGQWGNHSFLRAYHSLCVPRLSRPGALARWLDVSERTVADWISGRRCPPRAVVYAVWLESDHGREAMHTQLFNEARTHAAHARALQDYVARLACTVEALRAELADAKAARPGANLPANDGRFDDAPSPRPPSRPWRQRA